MHRRVSHKTHIQNISRGYSRSLGHLSDHVVQAFSDETLHLAKTSIGMVGRIGNSRHHVLPVDHLGIHAGFGGFHRARL